MKISHLETGKSGEALAVSYLEKQGYRIKSINYRTPLGEIDLIAKHKRTLCFIEVKTRRTLKFGRPEEAVGRLKQRKLCQLAHYYLKEKRLSNVSVRFDVLAIVLHNHQNPQFSLFQGAFEES